MENKWNQLTPGELRRAKILGIGFIIVSILVLIYINEIAGRIMLVIGFVFGLAPFFLGSKNEIENKIHVMRSIEPGYYDWNKDDIKNQIEAIESCGYRWFERKGYLGFKHKESGLFLRIDGLNYFEPEDIINTYKEVWSKSDPDEIRRREDSAREFLASFDDDINDED